ncbi:tryptophan synthase beta subunit-like PLP-dependent enzyme [Halteromyces radiatus]|uniref:tryptophan synthase beta subunit-like PLP-dependent enzyme n=1 Tax=Halteromyces radiatus TaxID=101107 RepID=UPI00221E867B|nr:tryptophan synthase beta subunit-like PLP-dependent enzyme [Halteromyces radiatus]KAI8077840.1 tryptophan synthase beta subunit-like PLP-dependent enzyme [Halteromyces radiatus]
MTPQPITIEDIQAAAARIHVHRTPVMTSSLLDLFASDNCQWPIELYFKCEPLQKTGSFKIRGATNAVNLLSNNEAAKGVVTHSSGNHAQALAKAALDRGIPAYVVMPNNAPQVKKDAVRGYGGKVIECEPTLEARETMAKKVIQDTGATFIHPFNNVNVMAGQGTLALEFIAQTNEEGTKLDCLIAPVGGGGMLSGCAVTAKTIGSNLAVFGAEPEMVNDTYRSFYANNNDEDELVLTTNDDIKKRRRHQRQCNQVGATSVADGLLTNVGELTYPILVDHVDDIFTVTEQQIIQAMQLFWSRAKLCIEPSAAVGLAVALYNKDFHKLVKEKQLKRIGIVLSGGNVDYSRAIALFEKYAL